MPNSLADRFHAAIQMPEKPDGCWLWTHLSKTTHGYGQIWQTEAEGGKRKWEAHRLSWTIHRGPIPSGMSVLHRCDVPSCCNPDHLFLGTQIDNLRDMAQKKRHNGWQHRPLSGTKARSAKLTDESVREIRRLRAEGWSLGRLGKRFGVWKTTISHVCSRKTWHHVP